MLGLQVAQPLVQERLKPVGHRVVKLFRFNGPKTTRKHFPAAKGRIRRVSASVRAASCK